MAAPLHDAPIPFITLPNWVKAAARCGFNIEPVFRELGIETDLIHLETATISQPLLEQAMDSCIRRTRTGHFPFVLGETFAFDYLPDLETFVTTSATLRDTMRVFDWVRELINPMIDVALEEESGVAALVLRREVTVTASGYKPYFDETLYAAIVKFGRMLLRGRGDFRRLCFRHAPPPYVDEYRRHFGLPVFFRQPRNALEMAVELPDLPLEGRYPALHEQAAVRVEQRLARLPKPTGLIAAIEDTLGRRPQLLGQGIGKVATELRLTPRTLQRRLQDEGQRFADVLARVRYRLALRYLEEPDADIESVSERLGFSDRRSFTRAFTRWSGVSPSAFRNRGKP